MDTRQIQFNEKEVESEEKVHIYPLSEKRIEHFMSLDIHEDDDSLFCEDCNYKYMYGCPSHALIPVQDPNVLPECEKGLDSSYCWKTLPHGLAIKESKIKGAGLGVFATKFLPARTRFGPYVGKKEKNEDVAHESGYSWQIFKDGKPSHFVNASDPSYSNWMRFVNCARNEDEQCVTAYQHAGEIYYRTNKDVFPGTELLVYYGYSCAKELGIDIQAFGKGGQITSSKEFGLPRVDNLIIPASIDHVRDPSQEHISRLVGDPMYLRNNMRNKHNDHHCQINPVGQCKEKVDKYLLQSIQTTPSPDFTHQLIKNKTQVLEKTFKCDVCGKGFKHFGQLTRHILTHSGEKPFKCDVCGKGFTRSAYLTKHKRNHSEEKKFKCDVCGKGFTYSGYLTIHKRIHSGEKPFNCDICGKDFTQSSYLTVHKRIHSGEKPFKCDFCGKCFTNSGGLTKHKRTHSGEKPFKCDVCGKCFALTSTLTDHKRLHSGEKPFKCYVCGKCFTRSTLLFSHRRKHSKEKEKSFKCDICEEVFTHFGSLTVHKRAHSGEKPFKCDVCGECFTHYYQATDHRMTHSREKPFKYYAFGKCFSQYRLKFNHGRTHSEEKNFKM